MLVEEAQPQAFCAGFLRPRVFLSTGALRHLGQDELGAVLAHEEHHRARRDPLRIALARVFSHAFFFLPVLRRLSDRYCAMAELAADDAAARVSRGGGATLASALLSFSASAHPQGAVGIAPERVDHLLGRTPSWRLPGRAVAGWSRHRAAADRPGVGGRSHGGGPGVVQPPSVVQPPLRDGPGARARHRGRGCGDLPTASRRRELNRPRAGRRLGERCREDHAAAVCPCGWPSRPA